MKGVKTFMHKILTERFSIPNHLHFREEPPGFIRASLIHESGSCIDLFLYGAHITSWKMFGRELLFMSRKAVVEFGVPLRGGIPIIFPQFGPGPMIKHGFARINFWDVIESGISDRREIFLKLRLENTPDLYSLWPYQYRIEFTVALSDSLTTSLRVLNEGETAVSFTSAFHTYFSVEDVHECSVEGLEGCEYIDTLHESHRETDMNPRLIFSGMIDRMYLNTPRDLLLFDSKRRRRITIKKVGLKDAVIWNPWYEGGKLLKDLDDTEYVSMLCVESAYCESAITLAPGEFWVGVQVLHAEEV
jgi:glucose-6-phosphate 1-epimerase